MQTAITLEHNPQEPTWHMRNLNFKLGYMARVAGAGMWTNPHRTEGNPKNNWRQGWLKAEGIVNVE